MGGMAALGVHQVDTFHYLAGPVEGVFARSTRLLPEGEVDDTSTILFQFESGVQGQLFTSMATGPAVEVTVHGTEAIARNTGDGARLTAAAARLDRAWKSSRSSRWTRSPTNWLSSPRRFGARASRRPTDVEARKTVAVLEAIVESAAGNRWVEVDYR